jgi:hypothetical protein
MSRRRVAAALAVCVLVALAGCAGGSEDVAAACEGATVAFHGDGVATVDGEQALADGYQIPGGADVFVVATVNGSVVGIEHLTPAKSVAADNATLALDEQYAGTQTATLVLYADSNQNDEFDGEIDEPCFTDGEPVQHGPTAVEFPSNESGE